MTTIINKITAMPKPHRDRPKVAVGVDRLAPYFGVLRARGGTGQPRPVRAISIPSTDDVGPFFRAGAKKPDRRLMIEGFPFRLRPHPARSPASLPGDDGSTSRYRRSSKKARP